MCSEIRQKLWHGYVHKRQFIKAGLMIDGSFFIFLAEVRIPHGYPDVLVTKQFLRFFESPPRMIN